MAAEKPNFYKQLHKMIKNKQHCGRPSVNLSHLLTRTRELGSKEDSSNVN